MATPGFSCLHAHSWYSLLEGVDSPAGLLSRASSLGYSALALTDSNSLGGAVELLAEARHFPALRPLVGARLRCGPHRCTALIAEPVGWGNLCRIISRITHQGAVPLVTHLKSLPDGLHVLADDPSLLEQLRPVYKDRCWAEVYRPRPEVKERELLSAATRLGVRPVASLAAHFSEPQRFDAYRLVSAVRLGVTLDKVGAKLGANPAHHLADPEEIHARFIDLPEAVVNAGLLAQQCRSDVLPTGAVMPPADVPAGQDADGYLRLLCERAVPERGGREERLVKARLDHELQVIAGRGLAPYFLAVGEIAGVARDLGVPTNLRGSAGSSLVCYLLRISDLDPLEHGLRLERFLHAGRADLPDIDLELESGGRVKVLAALAKKVGPDRILRVGSVHHYGPAGAFRAAALAHGLGGPTLPRLLDALEGTHAALAAPLDERPDPPGEWPADAPCEWQAFRSDAAGLVGRPYELQPHRSAVCLTPTPAEGYCPLVRQGGGGVAQLDKDGVEAIGLVKIDLLSSSALSTLAAARTFAAALDDKADATPPAGDSDALTLDLLARADTLGVAQVETPTLRRLLVQVRPRSLGELANVLAAARPGATAARENYLRRRKGVERTTYPHPDLEQVLKGTHGVALYEDDAIGILETLTGWPATEADRVRRRLLDAQEESDAVESLTRAAKGKGVSPLVVQQVVEQLKEFKVYGFCRAHALALASVAWRECWTKAHQPVAFWASAMNHHGGAYPVWAHAEESKRIGLAVRNPCVNVSKADWAPEAGGLRPGLNSVRGLPDGSVSRVLEERERGPFASLRDFRSRLVGMDGTLRPLIDSGAFDFTGKGRRSLLREAGLDPDSPVNPPRGAAPWPFGSLPGVPLGKQWREEWGRLGFLPGPPLMSLVRPHLPSDLADSRTLLGLAGEGARVAGFLVAAKEFEGERGTVSFLTLQDEFGLMEARLAGGLGESGIGPFVATGRVEDQFGAPVLAASRLEQFVPGAGRPQLRVVSEAS